MHLCLKLLEVIASLPVPEMHASIVPHMSGGKGGRREGGGREGGREGGRREGGGREGEGGRKSTCRESDGVGKLVLIFVHKLVHINQPCVHLGIEKGEVP